MPLNLYEEKQTVKVLAIAAGKGGVGKSTLTAHLALALKRRGKQVGILDADLYGPSIPKILPAQKLPQEREGRWIPAVASGIALMSLAFFRKEEEGALVRAPIANQLIRQFIERVDWGGLDWLLIDFPPGTGDIPMSVSQIARLHGAIMVTTPQELALLDVRKAVRLFQQTRVPIRGIVENMSSFGEGVYPFGRGGGEKLAKELGSALLGEIPLDPVLSGANDRGEAAEFEGDSSEIFARIAEKLEGD